LLIRSFVLSSVANPSEAMLWTPPVVPKPDAAHFSAAFSAAEKQAAPSLAMWKVKLG